MAMETFCNVFVVEVSPGRWSLVSEPQTLDRLMPGLRSEDAPLNDYVVLGLNAGSDARRLARVCAAELLEVL